MLYMCQAIQTKYHGPTNRIGARVSARCDAGRIMVSWDNKLNADGNHRKAAETLAAKLGWTQKLVGGGLPGGGYAFVLLDEEN